ncbi:MAG: hypothetical protein PWP31_107 [Clostridia bacterium]|nr:hypothetical protein [Clostridia bacterium]
MANNYWHGFLAGGLLGIILGTLSKPEILKPSSPSPESKNFSARLKGIVRRR